MATRRSPTRRLNQLARTAARQRQCEGVETGHGVDDVARRMAQGTGPVGSAPWARRTSLQPSESPRRAQSTTEMPRHPYAGARRERRVAGGPGAHA
jgi:hypothetical protein